MLDDRFNLRDIRRPANVSPARKFAQGLEAEILSSA
jgi:hypothetical protein